RSRCPSPPPGGAPITRAGREDRAPSTGSVSRTVRFYRAVRAANRASGHHSATGARAGASARTMPRDWVRRDPSRVWSHRGGMQETEQALCTAKPVWFADFAGLLVVGCVEPSPRAAPTEEHHERSGIIISPDRAPRALLMERNGAASLRLRERGRNRVLSER